MKKTNQRLLSPLLLLLAAMALLAFGVFTNVLTDLWGPGIKERFQHNAWMIAAFALLLALVGYLYANQSSRAEKAAAEAIDADQYDEAFVKFKALLLEQYQLRLNSKTGKRLPINLSAKSTQYGFDPARADIFLEKQTIESPDIAAEIDQILAHHNRLLLIGDPGAGKTTILLYAAVNILNHAQEAKLPLILNLATWQTDRNFEEWYAQSIAHTYSLSPVFVAELLRRNAIVPFFDGFDEVAEAYRDDSLQKMTAYFGDQRNRQLIVSSRKKEYAASQADAPVYAEIEVLPLSLPQIKKALSENALSQASDQALLDALHRDEHLAKAVETPFYLNTASFLFGKGQRTWANFPFESDSTEGRQAELVKIFVTEQVPEERDKKYLGFLAGKMEEESFLVFELVKMQPRWGLWLWRTRLIIGFCWGLLSSLLVGVFTLLVLSIPLSLSFSLYVALRAAWSSSLWPFMSSIGFLSGFLLSFLPDAFEVDTKDIATWHWSTFIKNWKKVLSRKSFLMLLFAFFISSLFSMLYFWLYNSYGYYFDDFIYGWIGGGTFMVSSSILSAGTTTNLLLHVSRPYQRFRNGSDVFSTIQHFSLRLVLYLEKNLPLRVVTFLDHMTDQHIFEDNRRTVKGQKMRGATWRFRHKILQDYFAKAKAQET